MPARALTRTSVLAARWGLGLLAALIVVWSFAWVLTRPLRREAARAGAIEITVLHWGDHEEDAIVEELKRSFEATHPRIRINRINAPNYFAKLQTMMAAGDPPDVIFLNSKHIPKYAAKGLLLDIERFLERDEAAASDRTSAPPASDDTLQADGDGAAPFHLDPDDFYVEALNSFRFDGTVSGRGTLYGLPMSFTPLGFYYNKTLFDQAGVPYPTDDWTWDEFETKAKAIGALDGCFGAEFTLFPASVRALLWTWGLDLFSPGFEELRFDDPQVRAVLEQLHRWRFSEGRMLIDGRSQIATGIDAFIAGNVGMYGPTGRWMTPNFRRIERFDWDFAQLPRGSVRANTLFVAAWCIASGSDHPEEAWAVARHFATPEGQRRNTEPGLALPTLKSVAESDAFLISDRKPHRNDLFLEAVERAKAMEWPADSRFEATLFRLFEQSLQMGALSVDEALDRAEAEWTREQASPLRGSGFPPMPWGAIGAFAALPLAIISLLTAWRWWRRRPGRLAFRDEIAGLLFISPWAIGFAAFVAVPMLVSLLLVFTKWSGITTLDTAQFVGLGNLRQLFLHDERFRTSLWVTAYYVILHVPTGQAAALAAALVMSREVRGIGFFRSAWYLPSVLAGVGIAVLWRWVFDGRLGLFNMVLQPVLETLNAVGLWLGSAEDPLFVLRAPEWFGRDAAAFGVPAFAIMSLWSIGGGMIIYLAGLNAIPRSLYEAAEIDGASAWKRFLHVTLPMLSPVMFFNFVIAIIASFQVFTQAYVMTEGGPGDSTRFYVLYLYNQAFEYHEMGYASAMAWILFVIVLACTLLVIRSTRNRIHYEGMRL